MPRQTLRAGAFCAVLAAAAGTTGCSDVFSAHAGVAAEAAGTKLPAERLGAILANAGSKQRITRQTAEFVAGTWVDYALFAHAAVTDKLPSDSASIAQALWPEISELKGTHFHDTLVARRVGVSDSAADSLYQGTDVRVVQHILFGIRPNAPADTRGATRRKAEGTLGRLRRGADFDALAAQLSEDPGSKADSGYLPPSPRGRFVPAFDSAAWALEPGQMSGLVETPFGFHIIRRPSLEEARTRLVGYLEDRTGARLDSVYMDSLAEANRIEVLKGAPATMRAAVESPDEWRDSDKELTRFEGGGLTVQEYLRWVRALPPQYAPQLRAADDSNLVRFARVLSQNVLLLREAESAGVRLTAEEWSGMRQRYLSQIDSLKAEMGLGGLGDSAGPARRRLAEARMEEYFDRLVEGKIRLRPLPSELASLLRERLSYRLHDAGINRAVDLALASTAAPDSTPQGGPMQRAPGPPPVPGAPPADSGARAPAAQRQPAGAP